MIKYPNGKVAVTYNSKIKISKRRGKPGNRGMGLEKDINITNQYYKDKNLCLITKRPTPISVVKVDYSKGAKIIDAYFEKQSTTDYNGVYKSRYIDFEAKSTLSKTSFPLSNIPKQQIEHLESVIHHGGITFFIIEFVSLKETYLIDAKDVIDFKKENTRSSLTISFIKEHGELIKRGFLPPLDYMTIVEEKYFKS